jgi:hypothetical protein
MLHSISNLKFEIFAPLPCPSDPFKVICEHHG